MNPKAFFEDFLAEHGEHTKIPRTNYLLFVDGAIMELTSTGFGATIKPPANPYEAAKLTVRFHEILTTHAVNELESYKESIAASIHVAQKQGYAPPDKLQVEDELKRLRQAIRNARKRLNIAREAMQENEPAYMATNREMRAEHNAKSHELLELVRQFKV